MLIKKLLTSLKQNCIYLLFVFFVVGMILIDTGGYNIKFYYSYEAGEIESFSERLRTYNKETMLSEEYSYELSSKSHACCIKSSQWTRKDNTLNLVIYRWNGGIISTKEIKIEKIEFRLFFIPVMWIDQNNYRTFIKSNHKMYESDNKELCIVPEDNAVTIIINSNDLMSHGGIQTRIKYIKIGIVSLLLSLGILFLLLDIFIASGDQSSHTKWTIVLISICCLIFYTCINGSTNASPDEDVSTGAVKYYYSNWGLPDYQSEDASMSYSDYGASRLRELTPYYFFAGKTGALFESLMRTEKGARMFNALLFTLMCMLYIFKGKRNKWMLVGLVFTPQLWYIFSYTTSDAWDYFLCYLLVLSLACKIRNRHKVSISFFQGVLLGLIMMGKESFYVTVLFFGLYMMFEVSCQQNKKKELLYLSISILLAVVIFISRRALDYYVYDGMKYKILSVVGEKYRTVNPIPFQKQGYDLYSMLKSTTFVERLLKSFAGTYGWMDIFANDMYYYFIGSLYGIFIVYIVRHVVKMKQKKMNIELTISLVMIPLMFFIILLKCWKSDFQAQGRYMLATILCLLPVLSKSKSLLSSRGFEFILEGLTLVGITSYISCQMAVIC